MISSLEKEITVEIEETFEADSKRIFSNLKSILHELGLKTFTELDVIKFQKIYKSTTDSGQNKTEAMKILRSGEIKLSYDPDNKIVIAYNVNQDVLKFMSVLLSILIGFFRWTIYDSNSLVSIFIGLITLFLTYSLGYIYSENKMNNIIYRSVRKKNKTQPNKS